MKKFALIAGLVLLSGCSSTVGGPLPGGTGELKTGYSLLAAKKAKPSPSASPSASPSVAPTPAPTESPVAPAVIRFLDDMNGFDSSRWHKADGWTNGMPFWCGWRGDNAQVADSQLVLRVDDVASQGQPYSAGEYRTNATYGYGRIEARMKAARGSGLVTGLFTYTGPADGQPHDEVDIEILGKDPTRLQVNYFTNDVGGHETMIELGFDASAAFHTYAFEWTPSAIRWYVDGVLVHTETGARGALPKTPGRIMANVWPAKGVDDWTGAFTYPGTPVDAQFDFIGYTGL